MWNDYYERRPRIPANGVRAVTGRGQKFGQTWWGETWMAALERLVDPNRLSRGRTYARQGQVLSMEIETGQISASVQGSWPAPYDVRIKLKPLKDREWNAVADAMANQARFAAKLLAGEMPENIENAFREAGASLFPESTGDLNTSCSCPDWANPCKHVSAVYYLLAEAFDSDPWLLFRLRGRDRDTIMTTLRARRAPGMGVAHETELPSPPAPAAQAEALPLEDCMDQFWTSPPGQQPPPVSIVAAPVDAIPVKQLGTPRFRTGDQEFLPLMERIYANISEAALDIIRGE
ncbi:SWIM zinc finger family protein [Nitrolancea hollandica]|uniref:SWIM-type domain-containing protein n=1 Tax=Nitrolancea hollandica Lb TaxID=1129897 RepID=I4EFQ7_9BACT|nr:SWIM zinc finger family protein [Nitrolancea hollandica]CCF83519.1 conserved hypothetical protein [Nitrolancea hollandica Lb]